MNLKSIHGVNAFASESSGQLAGLITGVFECVLKEPEGDALSHLRKRSGCGSVFGLGLKNIFECMEVAFRVFSADQPNDELKKDSWDESSRARFFRA